MRSIVLRLSTGSNSSETVTSSDSALGGKMGNNATGGARFEIPENTFLENAIFDNISASENIDGTTDYRCVFIHNNPSVPNARTLINPKVYISGSTYAKFQLGKASDKNIDATIIDSETTAPSLITFAEHTKDNKLVLGKDLAPGDRWAIWIKRTATNVGGAGSTNEAFSIIVEGSQ